MNKDQSQDDFLRRGVTTIIDESRLREKLASGVKLRVKFGVDPTGPQIHIGRAVPIWKLKAFQDLGHTIIFLIGDFTAQIGDASDKTAERPMLSRDEVRANMKNYLEQVGKILDISKCEIVYNSEWLSKLTFDDVCRLADSFSVSEMLDRDNFSKRREEGERISLREFMYPLMQGYDSVVLKADIELGGNDQYFNLMAGRTIQKMYGQEPQDILTCEFLVGLDGRKMSTSWGNGIFITDEPSEMFGKIMTLHDDLILDYFRLATDVSMEQVAEYRQTLEAGSNPRDLKIELGKALVRRYYGEAAATSTAADFLRAFSEKMLAPEDFPFVSSEVNFDTRLDELVASLYDVSKTEARRLLEQGSVKAYNPDDNVWVKLSDPYVMVRDVEWPVTSGGRKYIQKGKKDRLSFEVGN